MLIVHAILVIANFGFWIACLFRLSLSHPENEKPIAIANLFMAYLMMGGSCFLSSSCYSAKYHPFHTRR